jgi:hypothetical protein
MEIWKPLERLPGYEVSSHGRVRSLKSGKPKLMSVVENNKGYFLCCLIHNKKRYTSYAHRLVAEVFIPTKFTLDFMEVNHIDKNPKNNHVDNLEWVTPMENQLHRSDTERYKLLQRLKKVYDQISNKELEEIVERLEMEVNTIL